MLQLINSLSSATDVFASAGGGGSGGGSGDGGGVIALLGYVPTHLWGSFLRRKAKNPVGLTLMIIGTLVYGFGWWFFGAFGFFVSLGAFVGGPAGYYGWFGKISARVRKKAKQEITAAASQDPAWNEDALKQHVQDTFAKFQSDWSAFNTENMKSYLTPNYAYHIELMLLALRQRRRRNNVESPELIETYPTDVDDAATNAQDRVTFLVHAKAHDVLIENVDGQEQELFANNNELYEYWHFARSDNGWLLDNITQLTEQKGMERADVRAFAQTNNLYYSLDWGWLLLPRRGQLFGKGKFGTSDINNHVIGVYNKLLIELYTYLPTTKADDTNKAQYVIAQVALPKRYDSIIVEAKSGGLLGNSFGSLFGRAPKGYNHLKLEWPDFNKRYSVYATNVEQVTAFELLHPVYMEKLFALPFKVSIEVVDNVVYLYTKDKKADYELMYSILKDAFKEMKL
ncbi:MAG: TIM44-like domain-containing protein [Patescibacteria group bacterium]